MNERIRELAEQANKLSIKYANEHNVNFVDAFNNVFAKLIAKDCMKIADSYDNGSTDEWDICAGGIYDQIKRTFEVEQ